MFNDLVKILDAVLSVFRTGKAEARNEIIGHQLLKIFLEVDNIVEQGKLFFTIMKKDQIVPLTVGLAILVAIQESMDNLLLSFQHNAILKLVKLDLPASRRFSCIIDKKSGNSGFHIAQFTEKSYPTDFGIDPKMFLLLRVSPTEAGDAPNLAGSEVVNLQHLREVIADTKMALLSIIGTEEQIIEAANLLKEIHRLSLELRLKIINDFKFEDIF